MEGGIRSYDRNKYLKVFIFEVLHWCFCLKPLPLYLIELPVRSSILFQKYHYLCSFFMVRTVSSIYSLDFSIENGQWARYFYYK